MTLISSSTPQILFLAGSPNVGGNSHTLLQAFKKGVKTVVPNLAEVIHVYDLPMANYSHQCKIPLDDETQFKALAAQVAQADGLVLATPTFNFNVPAPVKNLVDRLGFVALDYKKMNFVGQPTGQLGNLKTHTIVTGGTPNHLRFFLCLLFPGFWLRVACGYYGNFAYSTSYAGNLTYSNPAKKNARLLKKYEHMGAKWAKKVVKRHAKRTKKLSA